jgi:hypothetical protein
MDIIELVEELLIQAREPKLADRVVKILNDSTSTDLREEVYLCCRECGGKEVETVTARLQYGFTLS